jgi:hypothetical protein
MTHIEETWAAMSKSAAIADMPGMQDMLRVFYHAGAVSMWLQMLETLKEQRPDAAATVETWAGHGLESAAILRAWLKQDGSRESAIREALIEGLSKLQPIQ